MNAQWKNDTNRGIEWTHRYGPGTGYTWPVIVGCKHKCRWRMPDGTVAVCYAETIVNHSLWATYPAGFESHYFMRDRLDEPLKLGKPAGIFIDSISDLFGAWVPVDQIQAVIDVCRKAYWHTFFVLTKNAPRLLRFRFPPNVWVGVSSPPSSMMGHPLTANQQKKWLEMALDALSRVDVPVRWLSAEPLALDIAPYLQAANLQWAVIGAASGQNRRTYQPDPAYLKAALAVLDARRIPVFFKGNLSKQLVPVWREEYPITPEPMKQLEMF